MLIADVAGTVAGAMAMVVSEFVSVSSRRHAEHANLELETRELNESHAPSSRSGR